MSPYRRIEPQTYRHGQIGLHIHTQTVLYSRECRPTDTQTYRHTDTDKPDYRYTHKQYCIVVNVALQTYRHGQTGLQIHPQTDAETHEHTEPDTDKQIHKLTYEHSDTLTDSHGTLAHSHQYIPKRRHTDTLKIRNTNT